MSETSDASLAKDGPEEQALRDLEIVAGERGQAGIVSEAREARAALANRRFNVAVMGQFKRGKSTLINALLGRDLLPTDVAPVTTALTAVEHGPRECAHVRFEDGREEEIRVDEMRLFVSEEENPGNRKGVRVVRIELPAPLLASGIRLVDTPGVGSVFANNSEVTRSFLSRIDVAVVVLGSDPPISGEELALVKAAGPGAGHLCFVLNKSDRVREATRLKAEAFTRRVLCEALGRDPDVIHASARAALRDGEDPGVSAVIHELEELAGRSGADLARGSAGRAARQIAAHLLTQLDLEQAALVAPLEEIDRRIGLFLEAMKDIDDLVLAACARVKSDFGFDWQKWEERKDELSERVVGAIRSEVERAAGEAGPAGSRQIRRVAREIARGEVRKQVSACGKQAGEEFDRHRTRQIERVGAETNRLINRAAEAAAKAFGIPVALFEPEALKADPGAMVFEFIEPVQALDVDAWLIPVLDAFSSKRAAARRASRRSTELAREWLRTNLYEIDRHLVDWIDALSTQLETGMRSRLDAMQQEVLDAVGAGRRRREEGGAAIEHRLRELGRQRETVLGAVRAGP